MRLLVYRLGAIGDTLTLTPLLHALRNRFDEIHLVGNAERLSLIDGRLHDRVHSFDVVHRLLPAMAQEADLSIAFAAAPMEGFGKNYPPFPSEGNIYDWMAGLGAELGGEAEPFSPGPASGLGTIIHPGSGSAEKNGPLEFFLEAAERAHADFVLGPTESPTFDEAIGARGFRLHRPATLMELKNLIDSRAAFLGNDSGPAHLAALGGLLTQIRFGTGGEATERLRLWRPPYPNVEVAPSCGIV